MNAVRRLVALVFCLCLSAGAIARGVTLTNRYALTDLASGQSRTFKTLQEALLVLGDLQRVLVSDEAVLPKPDVYLARARLRLITEELPAPMRPLVWISPSWWVSSPWYEWIIKR